jgi:hypothetical protein
MTHTGPKFKMVGTSTRERIHWQTDADNTAIAKQKIDKMEYYSLPDLLGLLGGKDLATLATTEIQMRKLIGSGILNLRKQNDALLARAKRAEAALEKLRQGSLF